MLNLLSINASANMQRYGFLSSYNLFYSSLFLTLVIAICVYRLPNLKSLGSSGTGHRGLESE